MSARIRWRPAGRIVCSLAILAGLAGCASVARRRGEDVGPFFVPANHFGAPSLAGIGRVVILPVWTGQLATPEAAAEFDALVMEALLRERRFEVVACSRQECRQRYLADALSSSAALPAGLFEQLRREHNADAVLFVDLTTYAPYPPLALGFRAKLARLTDRSLIWAFDEVFSTANAAVANSARRHAGGTAAPYLPAEASPDPLQSPLRFGRYAVDAMFTTLPLRPGAPSPAPRRGRPVAAARLQ